MPTSNNSHAGRNNLTDNLSLSVFLILLILFLPTVIPAAPAALSDEAQTCLTCHASPGTKTFGDKTTVSVQVDGTKFAASVHGSLGCTSCHSDVKLDNHPSAQYATKREFVLHVAKACRICHDESQLKASPLHQRAYPADPHRRYRSNLEFIGTLRDELRSRPMSASVTPRPICIGLRPPVVPEGSEAKRSVWLNWSANWAFEDLKPVVELLARLLPMTLSQLSLACKPERAE